MTCPVKGRATGGSTQKPLNSVNSLAPPTCKVGGAVAAPKLIFAPDPIFPNGQTKEGVVSISCIVDVTGQPTQVSVSRSFADAYDTNAVDAAEQYRFKPPMLKGNPVPVKVDIEINFKRF